ncbi:MAG: hypothetical protein QM793_15025 [Muricomes sp.]
MQKEDKKAIHKIFNLCMEIQSKGKGEEGFPYIHLETSNYGHPAIVWIAENGFEEGKGYDLVVHCLSKEPQDYLECERHLKRLLRRIKEDRLCCTPE